MTVSGVLDSFHAFSHGDTLSVLADVAGSHREYLLPAGNGLSKPQEQRDAFLTFP
jgi:hypothetical protein